MLRDRKHPPKVLSLPAEPELYSRIQMSRAHMVGPDGQARNLPPSLDQFLHALLETLNEAQSVSLIRNDAQVTTVEGARMLGVSRQFLIKLLDRGELPHHMVGTHRRLYLNDLLAYKAKRDSNRRKILDELARAETEDGLYDLTAPDDRSR